MLYQIVINWDDIAPGAALTSLTPITINKSINLYDGQYQGNIVGCTYVTAKDKNTSASNNNLLNISSSRFSFPASSQKGFFVSNRADHVQTDLQGPRCFLIDNIGGNLDISLYVQQFNNDRTKNNAATWEDTKINTIIISLDINKL
jgi:hypothetical protein